MKRISILATVVSVGLLYVTAFGAGSASAVVLCDQSPLANGYNCPPEHTYKVGDKFHFEGSNFKIADPSNSITLNSCTFAEADMTVTDAGGEWTGYPKTEITNWNLINCTRTFNVLSNGTTTIDRKEPASGSVNGLVYFSNTLFQTGSPFGTCEYSIAGTPELASESWITRLVFNKTKLTPSNPKSCPEAFLTSTLNANKLIYVFDR